MRSRRLCDLCTPDGGNAVGLPLPSTLRRKVARVKSQWQGLASSAAARGEPSDHVDQAERREGIYNIMRRLKRFAREHARE